MKNIICTIQNGNAAKRLVAYLKSIHITISIAQHNDMCMRCCYA